jgi:hypothetical protein
MGFVRVRTWTGTAGFGTTWRRVESAPTYWRATFQANNLILVWKASAEQIVEHLVLLCCYAAIAIKRVISQNMAAAPMP